MTVTLLANNAIAHVQDNYQKIFVCNGALSYEIQSFAADGGVLNAEQVSAIAETIQAHHKEQRTLCRVRCDEIISDYANLMAQIEELATNEEAVVGDTTDMDKERTHILTSETKTPPKKDTQPKKHWYETVDWVELVAQTAVAAAAVFTHRRNIKIF